MQTLTFPQTQTTQPDMQMTVDKLCSASVRNYVNPWEMIQWEKEIDKCDWFTSPELISIYGTEVYESLTEDQRKLLSFYEAVNFFSLNINGEKPLVEGMVQRMYRKSNAEITPYLHHFVDEENKHMLYFGNFCHRYAGKVYTDKKMTFGREYEQGEEDFLFFAKVMIFEELVDVYNLKMSLDKRIHPIARKINDLHHKDEARHLVFGRKLVVQMYQQYAGKWSVSTREALKGYLADYIKATWKEYYNPQVYRDAGIADYFDVYELAMSTRSQREHRKRVSANCVKFLMDHNMIDKEPEL